MSCQALGSFDWTMITINQAGASSQAYSFRLNNADTTTNRFTGTVQQPAAGIIRGVCRTSAAGITMIRFIMAFETRDSIQLAGGAINVNGFLQFVGTYTNLLDPGDTGGGSGGQSGQLLSERETTREQAE